MEKSVFRYQHLTSPGKSRDDANRDLRDGFFCPTLTLMMDSYII